MEISYMKDQLEENGIFLEELQDEIVEEISEYICKYIVEDCKLLLV